MKRLLISLCCVALLAGAVPLLAVSEGEDETDATTSSTTTFSTTESTTTTTTTTTQAGSPFTFMEYSRTYDETTGILSVTWNYASGGGDVAVIGVVVGGTRYSVSGTESQFSANIGKLSGGSYPLQYILLMADGSTAEHTMDPLIVGTTRALLLSLSVQDAVVSAVLTDENGQAVANYPLQFVLNRATTVNRTTDQNGRVNLTVSGTLTTVSCAAAGRTVGAVTYIGTSTFWERNEGEAPSTQPQDDDDEDVTTTSRSRWSATMPTVTTGAAQTYATIQGAGTTAVEGHDVAVNASFDEGVLGAFGLDEEDFHKSARLLMDADLYSSLVGDTKATVMMTLGYNAFEITDQHISKLVSGKSKYSRYTDIKRVAVTLGLQFVDENKKVVPITVAPEGSYTVRLPVPESMVDCPVLAVAVIEKDGLSHLIDVQVKNGYLEFVTNGFTSIAVLGFGDHAVRTGGGVAWQLIVLLVAGILMLAGAGLLMFFFVWRKPPKEAVAMGLSDGDGTAEDDTAPAEDLTSATEFMIDQLLSEQAGQPMESAHDQPLSESEEESRDLYSSDSRRPPKE